MICSASQIDSFWKTFVLSNDCESSIRAIVIEPPCFGVAERDATAAVAQRAETAARSARDRRRLRAFTFTPSDGGGASLLCLVYNTRSPRRCSISALDRLRRRRSRRDRRNGGRPAGARRPLGPPVRRG